MICFSRQDSRGPGAATGSTSPGDALAAEPGPAPGPAPGLLAGLPARLQDLPHEVLLLCADFMGVEDRCAFFDGHAGLDLECRAAGMVRRVRRADSVHVLAAQFALARHPLTRESTTVFMAIVRRAALLLELLRRDESEAAIRQALEPDVSNYQAYGDRRQRNFENMRALEEMLCACLGTAGQLQAPQRARLVRACLQHVTHPFVAICQEAPGVPGLFMARLLDGLLEAAEGAAPGAARALARHAQRCASMVEFAFDADLPEGRTLQQRRYAERLLALLARAPCRGDAGLVAAMAWLLRHYLPEQADGHASLLQHMLEAASGADLPRACEQLVGLFAHLGDAQRKRELLVVMAFSTGRTGQAGGIATRVTVARILGQVYRLQAYFPPDEWAETDRLLADIYNNALGFA